MRQPEPRLSVVPIAGVLACLSALACWHWGADATLHPLLRVGPHGAPVAFARLLSILGSIIVEGPLIVAMAALLMLCRRWREALWLVLTTASGRLLMEILKRLVSRPRPPPGDWLTPVDSWSFPSGHAMDAALVCFALAAVIGRRRSALAVAALVTIAIGWSRLALGVHWPSDVLGGWGIGLLWVAGASWVTGAARPGAAA